MVSEPENVDASLDAALSAIAKRDFGNAWKLASSVGDAFSKEKDRSEAARNAYKELLAKLTPSLVCFKPLYCEYNLADHLNL
jgi:hypothetical protein